MNILFHTCAHPKDLTKDLEFFVKTWAYCSLEELNNALKTGNYALHYAEVEKQILAGLLVMRVNDSVDVIYIYTKPAYRGRKLGLNLLKECEATLKKIGIVKKIFLEVRKDNIAAQKLYEAFAMKLISERAKYYKDGCDALIYCKEI